MEQQRPRRSWWLAAACAAAVAWAAASAGVPVARAAEGACPDADGTLASTQNTTDVAAPGGVASIDLGRVPRDRRVETDVLVQTGTPTRTFVVRGATRTRLRPDLAIEKVVTPKQALVGAHFTVDAVVVEQNGDVGASADVTLSALPGASRHVELAPGGRTTVSFPVAFDTPVTVQMTATVTGAAPVETDDANNSRTTPVDITRSQLTSPFRVLFPSLVGYGAQFGDHVYAPITPWPAGQDHADAEAKVKALEPQLVRIFYNDRWDANVTGEFPNYAVNYASFVDVVQLAQETGAAIVVSFQNLSVVQAPKPAGAPMAKFADVLEDLVRGHGLTNVRWAEIGNEPNSGATSLNQLNALYRALDAELRARGLRDQIHLMGPGLVENGGNPPRDHYTWSQWMATNMSDVLDAYNEHVYWFYDNPGRLEYRLRDSWYHARSLLFHTTEPGWQIIGTEPWDDSDWSVPAWHANVGDTTNDTTEQELAAYAGPSGEFTIVGLDTNGKSLNGVSTDPPSAYSIGGLPPNTTFTLAEWNATGDGTNSIADTLTSNDAGVVRFEVPLQAAFVLTTVPVS